LPGVRFVTPIAKPKLRAGMEQAIAQHAPGVEWTLIDGQSREAMRAADVVLLASGTATLECLLLGRPMVVSYRASFLAKVILRWIGLLKTQYVSLPNILSPQPVVAELLQEEATPALLGHEVYYLLRNPLMREQQLEQFTIVRNELKRDSAALAADAIFKLLSKP
jgi:lipid-A-disaccharide synthase